MKYRNATGKDAIGIAKVLKECYNIGTIKEGINVLKEEMQKKYRYIVADDSGRIAGLTTWQMHGLPKHRLCELDRIAVLTDYRGKGIAKSLFDSLVREANKEYKKHGFKIRKLYILTHANNKRAQTFYVKMGCRKESKLKSHYYKGVDEFVFSRFFK